MDLIQELKFEIRTDFDLKHEGLPIFKRIVDGSNPSIADTIIKLKFQIISL